MFAFVALGNNVFTVLIEKSTKCSGSLIVAVKLVVASAWLKNKNLGPKTLKALAYIA